MSHSQCFTTGLDPLARAVRLAAALIRSGTPAGLANYKAAQAYRLSTRTVAMETGKHGAPRRWKGHDPIANGHVDSLQLFG